MCFSFLMGNICRLKERIWRKGQGQRHRIKKRLLVEFWWMLEIVCCSAEVETIVMIAVSSNESVDR
jgi:hypothetical protein